MPSPPDSLPAAPASLAGEAAPAHSGAPFPPDEAGRLALLAHCQILDTAADPDFDDLTRLAAQLCGTPVALISLVDETRQWFKSRIGLEVTETPRRLAFCAHAILETGRVLIVKDATKDARFSDNDLVTGPVGIRFYAGAPLLLEEGHALGTLCVIDTQPREFTAEQEQALAVLARQVVTLLKLRRQNLALQQAEKRFREAIEYSAIGMALVALDGRWLTVNHALCAIVGRTESELMHTTFQELTHPDDLGADLQNVQELLAGRINHYQMPKRYFHKQGWIVWATLAVTLVRDAKGEPVYFVSQIEDITERRESERLLKASLEEKETLLKEVHHRVKNNLQVVTSLLSLQAGTIEDPATLELFQECQGRIRSMALIHEKLYQSETLARVDLQDYFESLAAIIFRTYAQTGSVRLDLQIDSVITSIDTAVPLGLLVNELLTNALKYAFPAGRRGRICVSVRAIAGQRFALAVEDDGIGLPADFQPGSAETLGMRLVGMFAKQLRAELTTHSEPGRTRIAIECAGALAVDA